MAVRQRAVTTLPNLMRSLRKGSPKAAPNQPLPSLRRAFSLYDQINLIDNVPEDQLRFQGYTDTGFTVNGVQYEGSLLCIGNLLLSWTPKKFSEITPNCLSIFQLVRPIPGLSDETYAIDLLRNK
ncbi:NADH dehydrogenase 1 alpha subcomplex assembly factor 3 [Citrus sinensis]|uniref:NADH dehydrogenase 1 alpha subcomplex assembly factor 3 n=1 Tax=Citrus sinensis TaxID=2711 RepID=A0ACB8MT46_CITSI|nr:NADH dehydrogenase 1 alpha subcomplex assembly factor 3 [Citrus sinensis]KAH9788865.1 NADH dehydrogenase 1 alpha subcomplex assembly factor 3 [Citrus sinensis]